MGLISAIIGANLYRNLYNNATDQTMRDSQGLGALVSKACKIGASGNLSGIAALAAQEKSLMLDKQSNEIMAPIYKSLYESFDKLAAQEIKDSFKINFVA